MRTLSVFVLFTGFCIPAISAFADEAFRGGDVVVKAKAAYVDSSTTSRVSRIGGQVKLNKVAVPDVSISYFFNEHIAVEATPGLIPHDVKLNNSALGNVDIGSIWIVAPTATLQYHRDFGAGFTPYVGVGATYAMFFRNSSKLDIEYGEELAWVVQAGLDYRIDTNWFANLDVKHTRFETQAEINDGLITADVNLSPWIYSAGVGYRF